MLTVKTKLDHSIISGIGLFAMEDIVEGQIVWKNNAGSELIISQKEYEQLSGYMKSIYQHSGYLDKVDQQWKLPLDNARFMNHASKPNTLQNADGDYVAVKRIWIDEEITCNYHEFDEVIGKSIGE
jgi:uncharacterized protein